jgi:ankyrin repeat domain-containing protein 50
MAEVLAVLTVITTVVQISEDVVAAAFASYQYFHTVTHAQKDVNNIVNVVGGLKAILERLKILIEENPNPQSQMVQLLAIPLESCDEALKELAKKLRVEDTAKLNETAVKVRFKEKLLWPWKEKQVNKILNLIEKYKSSFMVALTGDTLQLSRSIRDDVDVIKDGVSNLKIDVSDIKDDVSEIKDSVADIQDHMSEVEQERLLEWLHPPDPSENHREARRKHQPATGTWLLDSSIFSNWLDGTISSIWLHGIPGAGKTILSSTAIEYVANLCQRSETQYVYFYFDFSDPKKRVVWGLLRSIISHLFRTRLDLSEWLQMLYERCDHGKRQPSDRDLLDGILNLEATAKSSAIYLIIDALDECSELEELMSILKEMIVSSKDGGMLRLFVTSRREQIIVNCLQGSVDVEVNLKGNSAVGEDIDRYVHEYLETNERLHKWPATLREEIRTTLIEGANGM